MNSPRLVILVGCHSWEEIPRQVPPAEAANLLDAWAALWHPELIGSTTSLPTWQPADAPSEIRPPCWIFALPSTRELVPNDWWRAAEHDADCHLRVADLPRAALVREVTAPLGSATDPELVADFQALGFAYLQIRILTRKMGYSDRLDEGRFGNELVFAAQAAVDARGEDARRSLSKCFDMLAQERDHYYPVKVSLIDLTLLDVETPGDPVSEIGPKSNWLITGRSLEELAKRHPLRLARMRNEVASKRVSLVGGEWDSLPLPLLGPESILADFYAGRAACQEHLGQIPSCYGRRRYGLTPALPQILSRLAYRGALHFTLDDGRFPTSHQIKTAWEGLSGHTIDCLAKPPLDASRAETFLHWASHLSESMNSDHVATQILAHWPGDVFTSFHDLVRISRYAPVLGAFVTLDEYFEQTEHGYRNDRFDLDAYRSPYLEQSMTTGDPRPVSRQQTYWHSYWQSHVQQTVAAMECLLAPSQSADDIESWRDAHARIMALNRCWLELAAKPMEVGTAIGPEQEGPISRLASRLTGSSAVSSANDAAGMLVFNPLSIPRRMRVALPFLPAAMAEMVAAAPRGESGYEAIVDVPALGYVWLEKGSDHSPRSSLADPPLASGLVLQNEYLHAELDPLSGGLRILRDQQRRPNRISQRLALRRGAGTEGDYSNMIADQIDVLEHGPTTGAIRARGRLVDGSGRPMARYEQTWELWRGSRVLVSHIRLDADYLPSGDPWENYYAARFAWDDPEGAIYRDLQCTRQPTESTRWEAGQFIEIESKSRITTILTGGVPYHRRSGPRMLDSILIPPGELAREFRIGIGLDVRHSVQEALAFAIHDLPWTAPTGVPRSNRTGWLFHISPTHVVPTHWEPWYAEGRLRGFRVRLLETVGQYARVRIYSFRQPAWACQRDFEGQIISELGRDAEGHIRCELAPFEWVEVEATWG